MDDGTTRSLSATRVGLLVAGVLLFIWLCGIGLGACKSLGSTDAGQDAVVYNGGWLDKKDVREVIGPSSGYKVPGLYSQWRHYIDSSQQRYYTVSTDPEKADDPAATAINVPTSDGVQVAIEATTNFHTTFNGPPDDDTLLAFDKTFGNRTFGDHHVWDEDGGWEAFLDAQFRPVLVSTFREEIGALRCEELVSSCALVNQTGEQTTPISAESNNETSFQRVADAVQTKLQERMDAALGGHYLEGFQVNIEFVQLPEQVQTAIDTAQSAFAGIAKQRADAKAAEFEAKRTKILAQQYANNPEYAQIKSVEECAAASNCQIILGTSGLGLNVGSGK